ncbi:formyltransferase family protein [Aquitalea magnusonii]|uniref:formyltransferase family protein n=1 Tax=Aquitalea magnusonii TaxID=332411 RepID=UPI0007506EE5|nr:formyltransferase family protein [Aquitalea magnusonii]
MRFAITLTDRFKVLLDTALQAGWQPLKIFTSPLDGKIHDNRQVIEQAARLGIPVQLSPITEADLAALAAQGCETLLLGSYDWRVPNWRPYLAHAVNFHPSPLPEARGPFPLVRAILEQKAEWGVSCHVVEQDFDSGALLDRQLFAMAADETLNTLEWKCSWRWSSWPVASSRTSPPCGSRLSHRGRAATGHAGARPSACWT